MSTDRVSAWNEGSFQSKYTLGSKLGGGEFGIVRVAKQKTTNAVRAVKIIDLEARKKADAVLEAEGDAKGNVDDKELKYAQAEAKVLQQVRGHQHCVEFFDSFCEHSMFYIVMEKCETSVLDRLEDIVPATDNYLQRISTEMLLAVEHIHKLQIVHRDIKLDNFLLGGKNGETVKLCDFGMAKHLPPEGHFTGVCGTGPYMSPELVARKPYDFKTDIWSLGVTTYVLLCGEFPYKPRRSSLQAMKNLILFGPAPQFTSSSRFGLAPSVSACAFVQRLMARDQKQRCSAEEALRLPFVCGCALPSTWNSSSLALSPNNDQSDTTTKGTIIPGDVHVELLTDGLPPLSVSGGIFAEQHVTMHFANLQGESNAILGYGILAGHARSARSALLKASWTSRSTSSTCSSIPTSNSSMDIDKVVCSNQDIHSSDRN